MPERPFAALDYWSGDGEFEHEMREVIVGTSDAFFEAFAARGLGPFPPTSSAAGCTPERRATSAT